MCWRPDPALLAPGAGFDPSWGIGIRIATAEGLNFGGDIAFTYGPLGFLEGPVLLDTEQAILAALYGLATWVALGISLVWAARRSFPLWVAVPVALLAGLLVAPRSGADYPIFALALLWALVAITEAAPAAVRRLLPVAGGVTSAVVLLQKLNVGVIVFAACAVAVATMDRPRRTRDSAWFAASFAVAFLLAWLVTGQNVGAIPEFARYSIDIVGGYSSALALETVDNPGPYLAAAALLIALALAAAYRGTRGEETARKAGIVLLVALAGLFAWKYSFVRHETSRSVVLAVVPLVTVLGLRWAGRERWLALAAVAIVAAVYFPLTGHRADNVFRPAGSVEDSLYTVRAVLDPAERREIRSAASASMQAFYGLDAESLELLGAEGVHVYPSETGIVWAYGLPWEPEPVFQSLSAYTPALDELNAERLASPDGPARILVHPPSLSFGVGSDYFSALTEEQRAELDGANDISIDGRYLAYEQPQANLALLCNFEPLRTTLAFQVLARVPDRCGEPRPLGSAEAESGEAIEVPNPPTPADIVIAAVHGLEPEGLLERIGELLYKAPIRRVAFGVAPGAGESASAGVVDPARSFRLTPGVAEDGLLLSAPDGADLPSPFTLAPNAATVTFSEHSGFLSSPGELELDFYAIAVEPPGGAGGSTELERDEER